MVQASMFSNGGFVAHKIILGNSIGRFSAWFGPDDRLLDVEHLRDDGRILSVGANQREQIARRAPTLRTIAKGKA